MTQATKRIMADRIWSAGRQFDTPALVCYKSILRSFEENALFVNSCFLTYLFALFAPN